MSSETADIHADAGDEAGDVGRAMNRCPAQLTGESGRHQAGNETLSAEQVAEGQQQGGANSAPVRNLRAMIGIDPETKMPVFCGAERYLMAGYPEAEIKDETDPSASAAGDSRIVPAGRDSHKGASQEAGGMRVKEYFTNFDIGDAVHMMNPYLSSCAQLLDIEYLLNSLIDMKMLEVDDPIVNGVDTYIDNVVAVIREVGMDPDTNFLVKLRTTQGMDELFSKAQESTVLDAMTTAGKIFGAAMSFNKRRREFLLEKEAAAAQEAALKVHAAGEGQPPADKEIHADVETMVTAAEYYTKLFRKVSTMEEERDHLDLLVRLIDRISNLTNDINCIQPGRKIDPLPEDVVSEIAPEAAAIVKQAKARATGSPSPERPPKYNALNAKEVLVSVAELLPNLIAEDKLFTPGTTTMHRSEGIAAVSEKLLEMHLLRVPEEERFTEEAAAFASKYGDERAAVHALALLSDELNEFLSRLVMDDDDCDYEAEMEEYDEGDSDASSSAGSGSTASKVDEECNQQGSETKTDEAKVGADDADKDADLQTGRMPL